MSDYLTKAISNDGLLRAYAVDATELVQEAQQRHDTWSASSAAMGRSMVGTLLISTATLQGEQKLTTRVVGDGPVGAIVVDGNANGDIKGYVQHPQVNLPLNPVGKIDVRRAVGTKGMLSVTKDLGLKEPFTGQVPLVSGELGEDFTYYLAKSEQIPSAVGLSVFVNADNTIGVAGGFMIQVLPNADETQLSQIERNIRDLPLVSELLRQGDTPEKIIERILGKHQFKILEQMPVQFKCDCSKAHFGDVMVSLGKNELQKMIDEDGGAEAVCKFCGNKYEYSVADLQALIVQSEG
ncbi:Hsp33 family molecular chaperone HslO [Agrilactobacillus fermenti]|uniref:Hsp33 family molecular chaperone HslO n=1 Tax=Agrilactobacillus fermenti TaxID=2586909 RepID=UPI001E4A426E|nr:Hsp33 family molecular chaperone HslO [Agrilactobacillus fermenti]MCD2255938.1 Hsp33 family molecular chaperone HslO [Agrilactobacillus fermenti]